MTDQTPDPWKTVFMRTAGTCVPGMWVYPADEVSEALAAERARNQQEIKRLKMMGLPQRVADLMTADAHADEDIIKGLSAELAQRDETIRQLQDAFARCQEVQQATAETWRIEHDQMAEQIARLSAQVRKLEAELALARSAGSRDLNLRMNEANKALRAERDAAQQQIATLTQERDEALKVLAPNMPESGLVDACRQVKQVAVSEAGNSTDWMNRADAAEARCATLTAALDEYDRIDACSPTTPWCDAPGYVNAEHYDGHPAAKRELIAKMRAALSGVPTP